MIYWLFYILGIFWVNLGASLSPGLGRTLLIGIGTAMCFITGINKGFHDAEQAIKDMLFGDMPDDWPEEATADLDEPCEGCKGDDPEFCKDCKDDDAKV